MHTHVCLSDEILLSEILKGQCYNVYTFTYQIILPPGYICGVFSSLCYVCMYLFIYLFSHVTLFPEMRMRRCVIKLML